MERLVPPTDKAPTHFSMVHSAQCVRHGSRQLDGPQDYTGWNSNNLSRGGGRGWECRRNWCRRTIQLSSRAGSDEAGNLYVADRNNSTIRKIDGAGKVRTLAVVVGNDGSTAGVNGAALFSFPTGLAVDTSGVVYVADTPANTVRIVRSAAPQGPVLRMKVVAGLVTVCWPSSATGFILESRSDLSPDLDSGWDHTINPRLQLCSDHHIAIAGSILPAATSIGLHEQVQLHGRLRFQP